MLSKKTGIKVTLNNLARGFILLCVIFSCNTKTSDRNVESNKQINYIYNEKFRALYVNLCGVGEMPDSIKYKDIRHLVITCSTPIDFSNLLEGLPGEKIISIRIDSVNESVMNADFSNFKNLRDLSIFGTKKLDKLNLTNLGDSLKSLQLSGSSLKFPEFHSSMSNLIFFYYEGNAQAVPRWIENLTDLKTFVFRSKLLSKIECDLCKMKNIQIFSIVDNSVEEKNQYLQTLSLYPEIRRFKKCKPQLSFWNSLPPK
jgi:hypothetical protein